MVWYADTSAVAKLVIEEAETPALRAFTTTRHDDLVSSALVHTELRRTATRIGGGAPALAERLLAFLRVVVPDMELLASAGRLSPHGLRSLDALHLATALQVEADTFVAYDRRLCDAAAQHGFVVVSPM